jgi:hypothetical protein
LFISLLKFDGVAAIVKTRRPGKGTSIGSLQESLATLSVANDRLSTPYHVEAERDYWAFFTEIYRNGYSPKLSKI